MAMPLIVAMVAQRFRLRPVPERPVELDARVTLVPRHGLWMTLEPRTAPETGAEAACPGPA